MRKNNVKQLLANYSFVKLHFEYKRGVVHGATVGDPVAFSAMQPRCIPALSLLPATREKKELLSTEFKKTVIDDFNRVRFSDGVLFFYFVLLIWNINSITIKKQ